METEVNKITEIFKGHFQVILNFLTQKDLINIVDLSYKYIWGFDHIENPITWGEYNYTLYGGKCNKENVRVRNIHMEYLIDTSSFVQLIPSIHQTVRIIQTNIVPPTYLDLNKLKGKSKYDLLKNKIDYLFELEMPGAADFAPIVSPNINFLISVIEKLK